MCVHVTLPSKYGPSRHLDNLSPPAPQWHCHFASLTSPRCIMCACQSQASILTHIYQRCLCCLEVNPRCMPTWKLAIFFLVISVLLLFSQKLKADTRPMLALMPLLMWQPDSEQKMPGTSPRPWMCHDELHGAGKCKALATSGTRAGQYSRSGIRYPRQCGSRAHGGCRCSAKGSTRVYRAWVEVLKRLSSLPAYLVYLVGTWTAASFNGTWTDCCELMKAMLPP